MPHFEQLRHGLQAGEYDSALQALYGQDRLAHARARAVRVTEDFDKTFSPKANAELSLFSSPGRTEIGGNHTDHQRGRVLCASVNLDMLACAAPNDCGCIRIRSEGYPFLAVNLEELQPDEKEAGTSAALVRGVAARLRELGCRLSGFDACVVSDVLPGSGLSSSAAFEVLIANILNGYANGGLDAAGLAQVCQYAENVYFGKPCGLMDQMSAAVGGVIAIDFADPAAPQIRRVAYDFAKNGHVLCIVDTGSCHADLTDDYAAIPREMGAVAAFFGAQVLRDVPETEVYSNLPALRDACGDRAVLRAIHFYEDDRRAAAEADALARGDFEEFLALVNASGSSSAEALQNLWSVRAPQQQAIPLALALGKRFLDGSGAIRVHGGGFAGTVQAFVPTEKLYRFRAGMEAVFGAGSCHVLQIRPQGGGKVI